MRSQVGSRNLELGVSTENDSSCRKNMECGWSNQSLKPEVTQQSKMAEPHLPITWPRDASDVECSLILEEILMCALMVTRCF